MLQYIVLRHCWGVTQYVAVYSVTSLLGKCLILVRLYSTVFRSFWSIAHWLLLLNRQGTYVKRNLNIRVIMT
jgi:hypothetical protein